VTKKVERNFKKLVDGKAETAKVFVPQQMWGSAGTVIPGGGQMFF